MAHFHLAISMVAVLLGVLYVPVILQSPGDWKRLLLPICLIDLAALSAGLFVEAITTQFAVITILILDILVALLTSWGERIRARTKLRS